MKKVALSTLLLIFVMGWFSCTKDKGAIKKVSQTCDSTKVTYRADIKQIMDNNCSFRGCHDGSHQSPSLISYDAVVSGVNGNVICRMQESCGALMPSGGPKLADSLINKVIKWQTDGFCDTVSH